MKKTRLTLIALAAVIFSTTRVIQAENPLVRYADYPCNYNLAFGSQSKIDLAGVGGSRMLTAFDAYDLHSVFKSQTGTEAIFYNASHSHFYMEKEFVIARDLIAQQDVKQLVVMIQPRRWVAHPIHTDILRLAKFSDLVSVAAASLREQSLLGVSMLLQGVLHKVFMPSNPLPDCQDASDATCKLGKSNNTASRNCHTGDYRANLDVLVKLENAGERYFKKPLKWDVTGSSEDFHSHFIDKLVAFGKNRGTEVTFLFLPRTNQLTPPDTVKAQFEERYGARLLVPPKDILMKLSKFGRRDATHMNRDGRTFFVPWLLKETNVKTSNASAQLLLDVVSK